MSGIFGIVSKKDCADVLLYGTDYHSHMGTEFGGIAVLGKQFHHSIHDISKSQFKSKFFDDYKGMKGSLGIGVISDRDPQPLIIGSKFGAFAIAAAGLIENTNELATQLLQKGETFGEMSSGGKGSPCPTRLSSSHVSMSIRPLHSFDRRTGGPKSHSCPGGKAD